jgi:dTDP-4-amino-4,6-dideoxygalactose transaminase
VTYTADATLSGVPAVAGGEPAFLERLPLVRPTVPDAAAISSDLEAIFASRILTNGPTVRRFEQECAERLGVAHCVAVASCTAGLMLVLKTSDVDGEIVVPSFTFAATAHAAVWNSLTPVFADIDPSSLTLSAEAAGRVLTDRGSAILATHLYGAPCDTDALEQLARERGVRLFFDAAHAFGSLRDGVPVGRFGDAEVFSLSPTKLLVAGEGGMIATNDDELAERCRIGRDYGNPGDYDCRFVGLNARMSEVHAAIGLASLATLEDRIGRRNELAGLYGDALSSVPGISFPLLRGVDRSTFKDLTILVDPEGFGVDAGELADALDQEGIDTRRYYAPPVHATHAYRAWDPGPGSLPNTEWAAARCLTLPMWEGMRDEDPLRVAAAIGRIHAHRSAAG